jgi:hypothetical protein
MENLSRVVTEGKLIKDSSISDRELNELRERFKIQYASSKGWNPNNLTEEQLNEIYSDKRWKTPGLLFS